jgi:FAD/FMN-containing dehydrogenase
LIEGRRLFRVRRYSPCGPACEAEDFERLVALKDRYDPHNVFRFNRNIAPSKA